MKELGEALAGLRQSDREWRRGQEALSRVLKAWRAEPSVAPVLADMKRFGRGAPLQRCEALAELFDPVASRAGPFVASLAAAGIVGLDVNPLGQMPLPHASRDAVPALILAGAGRATLALAVYENEALATLPPPRTVRFFPLESWVRVVTGGGRAEHVVIEADRLQSSPMALEPDMVIYRHGPREALIVHRVDGAMVVLRLERSIEGVPSVSEYCLENGALIREASASREGSRKELVLALLASMKASQTGAQAESGAPWPG